MTKISPDVGRRLLYYMKLMRELENSIEKLYALPPAAMRVDRVQR